MELQKTIRQSRSKRLVPSDKFDRHMKRARIQDTENKKTIFCNTSEQMDERRKRNASIVSSTY